MTFLSGKVAVRLFTGITILAVFMLLLWAPRLQLGFSLFVAMLAAVGLYEYYAIVRAREISPETIGGILAGTAVAFSGHFGDVPLTSFCLYGGCLLVASLHIVRGVHSVAGLGTSVFGVFYVGWFGAHVVLLHRTADIGPGLVMVLLVAVVLTDTMAYVCGSLFGRHPMAPRVSPGKTWEGSIGGFVFALIGMSLLYWLNAWYEWAVLPDWTFARYIHAGAIVSLVAQIGDLAESCLKRDAGVKDSGIFFPGHGGVLDRCDGFLFAAPVLYYIHQPILAG